MASDLSSYKVASGELSSASKFNNLVQRLQDTLNAIGDPTVMAWVAGQILDVAQLKAGSATTGQMLMFNGSSWAPAASAVSAQPSARVYNNSAISLPNTTVTTLTFDSERWDVDNLHDPSTNPSRLTCNTTGVYQIVAQIAYAANTAGWRQTWIRRNGSQFIAYDYKPPQTLNDPVTVTLSTQYRLTPGDYLELLASQSSGGSLSVLRADGYSPEFAMTRISA